MERIIIFLNLRDLFQVFGQLPQFKDGDFVLYQSNSILRYLARKYSKSARLTRLTSYP